jgi:hypothetical protein
MTVEEVRLRLRRKLEHMLGDDEAAMLMDRPPGGWSDLVTNQTLNAIVDARFDALDHRLESLKHELGSRMDQLARDQTWRMMTALVTAMSILTAIFGILLVITGR